MLGETVERTFSWPLPSPMLMVPLSSTRWQAKQHRSRSHTVETFYSPLLPTAPVIPSLICVIKQAFFFTSPDTKTASAICPAWTQQSHSYCPVSAQNPQLCDVLRASLFSIVSVKSEYYQHSYQSFSFHGETLFIHFMLYVNYVVFVNVAQCFCHQKKRD